MLANPSHRAAPVRTLLGRVGRIAAPPSVLDFWAAHVNPAWSIDRSLARVVSRARESADAVTLVLRPNRNWRGFVPGQHANVTAEIDGRRITRSYSLSAVAGRPRCVAITVKAIADGLMSRHLANAPIVGRVLDLGQAFGDLRVPAAVDRPLVFLAGGSGITPLMAMLRELDAHGMPAPVTLLYSAQRRDELCYVAELRALAAKFPRFTPRFFLTREPACATDERDGRIDARAFASIADAASSRVFACGPSGFVESARALTAGRCATFEAESFTPAAITRGVATGEVEITLARSGRTVSIARGQPLLFALEALGIHPASGCRMGICNTCACGKASGTTRNVNSGDVEREPASALRLCVNAAESDLVIDL